MKKINWKGFAISLVVIAVIVGAFFVILNVVPYYASQENAEKVFRRNKDEFIIVAEYMADNNYISVQVDKNVNKVYGVTGGFTVRPEEITDKNVVNAVERLFSRGIITIHGHRNSIIFLRWRRFNDFGAGIVCSIDAGEEPTADYLTKLEPLPVDGWYYYESDYNEWRLYN